MYSTVQLLNHSKLHSLLASQNAIINDNKSTVHPNIQLSSSVLSSSALTSTSILNNHLNDCIVRHSDFFDAMHRQQAMHYIVNKQFTMQYGNVSQVSQIDSRLHTLIASLGLSQTKKENHRFAQLMYWIDKKQRIENQKLIDERNFYR